MNGPEHQCPGVSDSKCRKDLLEKIDENKLCIKSKLSASILWKAILVFFAVWGIAYGIYAKGQDERKVERKETRQLAQQNEKNVIQMQSDLRYLKEKTGEIKEQNKKILQLLDRINRNKRHND